MVRELEAEIAGLTATELLAHKPEKKAAERKA
jgi:hypothetical protein